MKLSHAWTDVDRLGEPESHFFYERTIRSLTYSAPHSATVALLSAAGHRRSTLELHKRMRRPTRPSGLVLF
jgi:hypothetical protein